MRKLLYAVALLIHVGWYALVGVAAVVVILELVVHYAMSGLCE